MDAGQIRSALMTTAITDVVKEDGTTPADPLDMGAGRIDVGNAIDAPLLLDESAANFATMGNDPVRQVDLNLPSINAPVMPGKLVTTRTVTNVSGQPQAVTLSTQAPAGTKISVSPSGFGMLPGQSRTFTVTIEADAPTGTQQFGSVSLSTTAADLHLPVAFVPTQSEVTLTQSCAPTTVPSFTQTQCTVQAVNNSPVEQDVQLDSKLPNNFFLTQVDGLPSSGQTVHKEATLSGPAPGVPAATSPGGFGFIPLQDFGITPTPIGDEQIINFNTPAYEFAGQRTAHSASTPTAT